MASNKRTSVAKVAVKSAKGADNARPNFSVTPYATACRRILRSLDTVKAAQAVRWMDEGNWLALAKAPMPDPSSYSDSSLFARDYLAYGLLRKCIHLPILVDRESACLQKWWEAEETCRWVNRNHGRDPFEPVGPIEGSLEAIIWTARQKIQALLGDFSWDEAEPHFGFSAGSTTRLPRRKGHPFYKYSGKPEVTRNAALLAICAIWRTPLWRAAMQEAYGDDPCNWVTIVEGSNFLTVGKTALVDRGICQEPDMNMFLQRGIGAVIRSKLKGPGCRIDLDDQTCNQRLALIGSRTGSLATIDLASASDSVSLSLVEALLPPSWFKALMATRCEWVVFKSGKKHRLEKISSMGNGYTFELESLIFWALAKATIEHVGVSDKRLGVYGDDIIVHHEAADTLIRVLARCGFQTNVDKTFVSGPFRESCGKHYFLGQDVTPFHVKEQNGALTDWFWLANSYRLWAAGAGGKDAHAQQCYGHLLSRCRIGRKRVLPVVPESLGLRAGVICNLDEACPIWSLRKQAYGVVSYVARRRKHVPNGVSAVLAWLQSPPGAEGTSLVVEKGDTTYVCSRRWLSWWDCTSSAVTLRP